METCTQKKISLNAFFAATIKRSPETHSLLLDETMTSAHISEAVGNLKPGSSLNFSLPMTLHKLLLATIGLPYRCIVTIPCQMDTITAVNIAENLVEGRGLQFEATYSPVKLAKIVGSLKAGCYVIPAPGTPLNVYLAIAQSLVPGAGLLLLRDLAVNEVARIARKLKPDCYLLISDQLPADYLQSLKSILPREICLITSEAFVRESMDFKLNKVFIKIIEEVVEFLPKGTIIEPPKGIPTTILAALQSVTTGRGFVLLPNLITTDIASMPTLSDKSCHKNIAAMPFNETDKL